MTEQFGRIFLLVGGVFIIIGLGLTFGGRFNIGRLPGDIIIQRENFTFYFPLMTGIVLSIILTLLFSVMRRIL